VKTLRGDLIKAKEIIFDTSSRQLSFNCPKGDLSRGGADQKPIHFAANSMLWNEQTHVLTLRGKVQVKQSELGNLDAEDEVRILQHVDGGKRTISTIETAGRSVLSYTNEDKNLDHCLTCHGSIKVDHIKMEAWLFSPKNEQGSVIEGKQIHLDDIKGEIFADKAFIKYDFVSGEAVPSKIILGGNVRILNTLTRHENGMTTALQYAIADQVEYIPHSNEMLFKANSGRRVLFFDKTNNLQVSAPALKVTRGSGAQKEIVQGFGDVRFSFIEHEFEQLRKRFAFDKANPTLPLK
jgi:hypothetical protein